MTLTERWERALNVAELLIARQIECVAGCRGPIHCRPYDPFAPERSGRMVTLVLEAQDLGRWPSALAPAARDRILELGSEIAHAAFAVAPLGARWTVTVSVSRRTSTDRGELALLWAVVPA